MLLGEEVIISSNKKATRERRRHNYLFIKESELRRLEKDLRSQRVKERLEKEFWSPKFGVEESDNSSEGDVADRDNNRDPYSSYIIPYNYTKFRTVSIVYRPV